MEKRKIPRGGPVEKTTKLKNMELINANNSVKSDNAKTPSRPTRERKNKTFDDYLVLDNRGKNFATSTPKPEEINGLSVIGTHASTTAASEPKNKNPRRGRSSIGDGDIETKDYSVQNISLKSVMAIEKSQYINSSVTNNLDLLKTDLMENYSSTEIADTQNSLEGVSLSGETSTSNRCNSTSKRGIVGRQRLKMSPGNVNHSISEGTFQDSDTQSEEQTEFAQDNTNKSIKAERRKINQKSVDCNNSNHSSYHQYPNQLQCLAPKGALKKLSNEKHATLDNNGLSITHPDRMEESQKKDRQKKNTTLCPLNSVDEQKEVPTDVAAVKKRGRPRRTLNNAGHSFGDDGSKRPEIERESKVEEEEETDCSDMVKRNKSDDVGDQEDGYAANKKIIQKDSMQSKEAKCFDSRDHGEGNKCVTGELLNKSGHVKTRGRPRKLASEFQVNIDKDEDSTKKTILGTPRTRGRSKKNPSLSEQVLDNDGSHDEKGTNTVECDAELQENNEIMKKTILSAPRKRGRPKKVTSLLEQAVNKGGSCDEEEARTVDSGTKSRRGAKRKIDSVSGDEHDSSTENDSSPLAKKSKSSERAEDTKMMLRSPAPMESKTSENKEGSVERCQSSILPGQKKRGRPPKIQRILPQTEMDLPLVAVHTDAAETVCRRCGESTKNVPALKMHMMTVHSLIWEKNTPFGIDNCRAIIKKLGFIGCPQCKKRFKFPQYYKHHELWCGKENEIATCDICNKGMKAMWLKQHITAHKTQERYQAEEEERLRRKEEMGKKGDGAEEEKGADGESSGNIRSKRKAAKSAIKLLSSLREKKADNDDEASSGEEYERSQDEESSDEGGDDESDGEEEEEGGESEEEASAGEESGTKLKRGKNKKKDRNKVILSSKRRAGLSDWDYACVQGGSLSPACRLQQLHKFYSQQAQGQELFLDLLPVLKSWTPLQSSEQERYTPKQMRSAPFTWGEQSKPVNCTEGETSLLWGETVSSSGKSYCYVGGPIWAVEWCPLPDDAESEQVVAVVTDLNAEDLPDAHTTLESPGLVQIWSAGILNNSGRSQATPVLEYSVAHDYGYVRSISWCPKRCWQKEENNSDTLQRLGLLAVACSNGRVVIYSLPHPRALQRSVDSESCRLMYRPRPAMSLTTNMEKSCGPCLCVAWQQGGEFKYVVAGFGQGAVFVWNLVSSSPLLKLDQSTVLPACGFMHHATAVLSCAWNPRNPSVFVTSSLDHSICMWNVERPPIPISIIRHFRNVFIHHSLCWAGPLHPGFLSTTEKLTQTEESSLFFHGLSRTAVNHSGMAVAVQNHTACVWDVTFCPFCEIIVSCDAIGKVKVTVPPMQVLRCKAFKNLGQWHKSACLSVDLYHMSKNTRVLDPRRSAASENRPDPSAATSQEKPGFNNIETNHASSESLFPQTNGDNSLSTEESSGLHSRKASKHSKRKGSRTKQSGTVSTLQDHGDGPCENSRTNAGTNRVCESSRLNELTSSFQPDLQTVEQSAIASSGQSCSARGAEKSSSNIQSTGLCSGSKGEGDDKGDAAGRSNIKSLVPPSCASCGGDHDSSTLPGSLACCKDSSCSPHSHSSLKTSNMCQNVQPCEAKSASAASNSLQATPFESDPQFVTDKPLDDVGSEIKTGNSLENCKHTRTDQLTKEGILHFQDCKMAKSQLKKSEDLTSDKCELEDFGGSNINAIHRVHLNPNPPFCVWLASGGQSGLLRLDNISDLIQPHVQHSTKQKANS